MKETGGNKKTPRLHYLLSIPVGVSVNLHKRVLDVSRQVATDRLVCVRACEGDERRSGSCVFTKADMWRKSLHVESPHLVISVAKKKKKTIV